MDKTSAPPPPLRKVPRGVHALLAVVTLAFALVGLAISLCYHLDTPVPEALFNLGPALLPLLLLGFVATIAVNVIDQNEPKQPVGTDAEAGADGCATTEQEEACAQDTAAPRAPLTRRALLFGAARILLGLYLLFGIVRFTMANPDGEPTPLEDGTYAVLHKGRFVRALTAKEYAVERHAYEQTTAAALTGAFACFLGLLATVNLDNALPEKPDASDSCRSSRRP